MVFDSFSQQCQLLSQSSCKNNQKMQKCDSSIDTEQIPDPNDCSKFKKCINNFLLTFTYFLFLVYKKLEFYKN
jgi:hypothetical protein